MTYKLTVTHDKSGESSVHTGSNPAMLRDYLVAAVARAGHTVHAVVEQERTEGVIWKGNTADVWGFFEIAEEV